METIQEAKKDFESKEKNIIKKAEKSIEKISEQFNKHERQIGNELLDANISMTQKLRKENTLNKCPKCSEGDLTIMYSKKTKRFFVACNKYPDCKNTYSLPPNGIIKPVTPRKMCEECGWPMLIRISKGKRPWVFCFNPECETNKKRIEEYQKRKNSEE